MTNPQKIPIHGDLDIINMRMAVREYARRLGFSLTDQASVSITCSNLAYKLGLGGQTGAGGEIQIEQFSDHTREGMRVRCIKNDPSSDDYIIATHLGSSHWLVDDIKINSSVAKKSLAIDLIKWNLHRQSK